MIAASPKITRYRIVFTAAYVFPSFDDHHETEPSRLFLPTENPEGPFAKGDLGGFSTASEIPPDPPLPKGGTGKDGLQFDLSTHRVSQLGSRSAFDKRLQEVMQPGIRAPLIL